MRERITFIHGGDAAFDPRQIEVQKNYLHVEGLAAAREDQLTFGHEVPPEIWAVLEQSHKLHIRWSSSNPYPLLSPLNARTSPGLHVFYTPRKGEPSDLVCPLLKKLFGESLKCDSPQDSFTPVSVLSERFASSSSYQYYQVLPSLMELAAFVKKTTCISQASTCRRRLDSIEFADYMDIDFDSISSNLIFKTYRHRSLNAGGRWSEYLQPYGGAKLEIGFLAPEHATEPEQIKLGGFLHVVGEDDQLNPTLFSFSSRHHSLSQDAQVQTTSPSTYTASFLEPTGLHPQLRLAISSSVPQTTSHPESCALHAYLTLPSTLFPDKYQLANPNLLKGLNIRSVRSISGYTDLEAPDYAVKPWGSSMLLELESLNAPLESLDPSSGKEWNVDIPLHLRYLAPTSGTQGIAETSIPWPVVFWACTAEEGSKMGINPFDRTNLGFDGLFGTNTMFYHLKPKVNVSSGATSGLVEKLPVPVLDAGWKWMDNGMVQAGTGLVVLLGWLWVVWKLFGVAVKTWKGPGVEKEKKKQ